jgi:tetratricopeptide (TPR) repeat protein
VERALQHEELGETEEARTQLNQGIEHARLQHQRLSRMDAALALLKAEQAYGEFLLRQKDISSAETAYAEMVNDAKLLDREHDRPAQIMRYEGEALGRIGDQQSARGDFSKAATSYDDAATSVTNWVNAATSEQRKPNPQAIAWVMRLHRLAAQRHMDLNDVEGARERFQRSLSASQLLGEPAESSRSLQIEIAYADAGIFRLETAAGNAVAAENAKQSALSTLDAILQSKNSTPNLKSRARELKQSFQP